jgi:SHS2 domain-containing protein
VRYTLPQPFEDLGHTADLGVRVRGDSAEEALARLALALGSILAGDAPAAERDERVSVTTTPPHPDSLPRLLPGERAVVPTSTIPGGEDLAAVAVALLRELLFRFATERSLPAAVEIHRLDGRGAEATVGFARWDPARHREGADVKAVTWHAARLEPEGRGWVGQVVLDI